MLVHPQFDPVAFTIGPFSLGSLTIALPVRWYGLMYLVGFVLFVVLGKLRARQNLVAGWHELPRRLPRRADRVVAVRASARQALARRHRFRRAAVSARTRRGAARKLHQRRAVGTRDERSVGHGVPAGRPRAAAPVAALRIRARGRAAVLRAVVLHAKAAAARRGVGTLPAGLRRCAFRCGIRARAGQLPRVSRARPHDGPMAVAADDPDRRRDDDLGVPARSEIAADGDRSDEIATPRQ